MVKCMMAGTIGFLLGMKCKESGNSFAMRQMKKSLLKKMHFHNSRHKFLLNCRGLFHLPKSKRLCKPKLPLNFSRQLKTLHFRQTV